MRQVKTQNILWLGIKGAEAELTIYPVKKYLTGLIMRSYDIIMSKVFLIQDIEHSFYSYRNMMLEHSFYSYKNMML